jgi:gliding motility-associated-like protein
MKYKFILILSLIGSQAFSQTGSLISVGSEEGMTITAGGILLADGLSITPTEDFTLSNTNLDRVSASTAKLSNQVSRVYQFSNPSTSFSGSLSMIYSDSELNGLSEQDLQLFIFNPSKWYRQATQTDATNNSLSSSISSLSLSEITSAVFMPNLILTASSIAENSSLGSKVIDLVGTDENVIGEQFTYSLVSGTGSTDNTSLKITGSELQTNTALDFETKKAYSVRLRVTDAYGRFDEKALSISITDVNETPSAMAITKSNLYESNTINQVVGALSTTDQDAGDSHTYSLVSGTGSTDNAAFNVSGNQIRASQVFSFATKNSYSIRVRATDKGGLSFEKVYTVSISQLPTLTGTGNEFGTQLQAVASTTPKISKGFTSKLNVSGIEMASYSWSPSASLSSTNTYNPTAKPNQTQSYSVTVTNVYGSSTTLSITVEVVEDWNIVAYNILTPNGDGQNDKWEIENISSYPNNQLIITDRSSRIVYQKSGYANDWNGLFNGAPLPTDTYYYILTFDLPSGKKVSKKGFITITQ